MKVLHPCFKQREKQGNDFYGYKWGYKFTECEHPECLELEHAISTLDQAIRDHASHLKCSCEKYLLPELRELKQLAWLKAQPINLNG